MKSLACQHLLPLRLLPERKKKKPFSLLLLLGLFLLSSFVEPTDCRRKQDARYQDIVISLVK